jgi:hypothetical protein
MSLRQDQKDMIVSAARAIVGCGCCALLLIGIVAFVGFCVKVLFWVINA